MAAKPNSEAERYAGGPGAYANWLDEVDCATYELAGLSVFDLADVALVDWFDDGIKPRTAARMAIREERS